MTDDAKEIARLRAEIVTRHYWGAFLEVKPSDDGYDATVTEEDGYVSAWGRTELEALQELVDHAADRREWA